MSESNPYGVQDDGTFERKPIDVIREDIKQDFLSELGEDFKLRANSPLTQIINAVTVELSKQWALTEASYFASFFEDSFGKQLDKKLALAGFKRRTLRGATGEVRFELDSPATSTVIIAEGTRVEAPQTETRPRIPFVTTERAEINSGQTSTLAMVKAVEPWNTDVDAEYLGVATNLSAGSITAFTNPQPQIDTVTNPFPMGDGKDEYVRGRDRETDAEFKNRYVASFAQPGNATLDAIEPQVFNADPGIVSADAQEVHNKANDDYGVRVTVLAPSVPDAVIAQAIFDSRAAGMESFGSESGNAVSNDGETYTEQFERAEPLYIKAEIDLITDENFPTNGETEIIDRLIRFVGGETSNGTTFPGLKIGEDVIYDQFFRRIINQQGVVEANVTIGPSGGTLDQDNVSVGDNVSVSNLQAARLEPGDVTFL